MKRFWLVLLALGMVMAFSASVFAADVKFSGSYYAAGMYQDNTKFVKDTSADGPSTAFYYQRLRVNMEFIATPALKLVTRWDAMERVWGAPRSAAGTTLDVDSAGTTAENENIAFDWVYINYKSPIGVFDIGIMNDGSTGTIFGNSYAPAGRIKYSYPIGPWAINLAYTKGKEKSLTAKNPPATAYADADNNKYGVEGTYAWKDGKAGFQVNYYRYAENRPSGYKLIYTLFTPYAMAKIGPVSLQAEINYATGKLNDYENGTTDIKLQNLTGWIDATATFGPVYFGGTFAYVSGDDPGTADKSEGGTLNGGRDWNPCLILFNYYDRTYWAGNLAGYGTTTNGGPMSNAFFYQGRVGFIPISALDIVASLSFANADKLPASALDRDYGWEVDVTATYKITNNLSYMLGGGYLFTGDYFKSTTTYDVTDNFMIVNKLTLSF